MPRFYALLCASTLIAGTAFAADRTYDVDGFDAVRISDGVSATIISGEDFLVEADAKRGNINRLIIKRKGDTLMVSRKASWGLFGKGSRDRFEVEIHLPTLTKVTSTAGAATHVSGKVTDLEADSSSGASLELENLAAQDVTLHSNSGASLKASGSCDDLNASSSSGASLRATDMTCRRGVLDSSSGASLHASLSDSAAVSASSGASITLAGGASIESSEISGGASLREK